MLTPGDKVLFVFSDPGGAKPLLALIAVTGITNYKVISDRIYTFYEDFNIPVHPYIGNAEDEVKSYGPDLVFTSTSYTSEIEKEFLVCAKEGGIPCIAYIDHWTKIGDRLILKNKSCVYPDKIWVLNERAKQIALKDGLWEKRLYISGNPYHTWLKKWKPKVEKKQFFNSLGITDMDTKLLLYAPDPLSNVNGKLMFGFDEISATTDLINYKCENIELFQSWKILVKAHPNQNLDLLHDLVKGRERFIFADSSVDANTCIFYSDLVLGYYSAVLIEAMLLGKPVVRYLPSNLNNDPLSEESVGEVISSMDQLAKFLM